MKKTSNNKNNFTAILKPYNEDVKRHMSALAEEFQSRVEAIGEQFTDLNEKMEDIKETQQSHTNMIGQLMVDMTEVKNGLKAKVTQDDFAKLEKRVVRLETKVR